MTSALITVYYPSEATTHNVATIARQVDAVYICDNSPVCNQTLFSSMAESNIHYVFFGENLGISRAFNRVLNDPSLPWQEDSFVFFFDQDSRIPEQYIDAMVSAYESAEQAGHKIGCLGSVYYNTSSGVVESPRSKQWLLDRTYVVSSVITSSMLSRYGNLRKAGFWNEDVFLDMADWDLCWRLQKAGMLCCLTEAVVLRHDLGIGDKKIGLLHLRVGHPYREYYQIRDSLYLLGKPYTPFKYRIRFLAMLLIRSPLHLIFLEERRERLRYISMGVSHFIKKKKGPLDLCDPGL